MTARVQPEDSYDAWPDQLCVRGRRELIIPVQVGSIPIVRDAFLRVQPVAGNSTAWQCASFGCSRSGVRIPLSRLWP